MGGLSLKIRGVLEMDQIDDVRLGDSIDPCGNCSGLILQCEVERDEFRVRFWSQIHEEGKIQGAFILVISQC